MSFADTDYASDSGMLTAVWGPALWHTLHTISFNYPVAPDAATQRRYRRFLLSLRRVLPCRHCRENYASNLRDSGFGKHVLASRDAFSRFVFDLHERVNTMLGKTSGLTYARVRDRYENFRSRCLHDPTEAHCQRTPAGAPVDVDNPGAREKGCTEPLYGKKSKCLIRIVPKESEHRTFAMDRQCRVRKGGAGGS